jgi:hypothetical protein
MKAEASLSKTAGETGINGVLPVYPAWFTRSQSTIQFRAGVV